MSYYIAKIIQSDFDSAVSKITESLKKQGFGVLSEINIHEKLKEKLDIDFRKYRILGACNPPFAYEALQKEDKIGTMLPCNVIVQERDKGQVEIAAVDPIVSMQGVENPELAIIASRVKESLQAAIDEI
ncbi:MAG: DUF302 domain-containing protein [bacterium]